jgi:hypothetical protein
MILFFYETKVYRMEDTAVAKSTVVVANFIKIRGLPESPI